MIDFSTPNRRIRTRAAGKLAARFSLAHSSNQGLLERVSQACLSIGFLGLIIAFAAFMFNFNEYRAIPAAATIELSVVGVGFVGAGLGILRLAHARSRVRDAEESR